MKTKYKIFNGDILKDFCKILLLLKFDYKKHQVVPVQLKKIRIIEKFTNVSIVL